MEKIVLAGSSNPQLGKKLAEKLDCEFAQVEIEKFPNMETRIRVISELKNKDVIIVQPTDSPPDTNIIELVLLANAAQNAGATRIQAVIPWFGYSPQDKIFRTGEPLSCQAIIKILETTGIEIFYVLDIHASGVLNFFSKKVINISAKPIFVQYFTDFFKHNKKDDWIALAVDKGDLERATAFAEAIGLPLAVFDKTRDRTTGEVTFHKLKGDVKGKNVITFDDFVSTGGTLIKSCDYLKENGIKQYVFCVTHIVVEESIPRITYSSVDKIVTTNSVSLGNRINSEKIAVLDVSGLLAEAII